MQRYNAPIGNSLLNNSHRFIEKMPFISHRYAIFTDWHEKSGGKMSRLSSAYILFIAFENA